MTQVQGLVLALKIILNWILMKMSYSLVTCLLRVIYLSQPYMHMGIDHKDCSNKSINIDRVTLI